MKIGKNKWNLLEAPILRGNLGSLHWSRPFPEQYRREHQLLLGVHSAGQAYGQPQGEYQT